MFHTHPALVQTLLDDRYRRLHHPVPTGLTEVRSRAGVRAARRAARQAD